MKISFDLDDTLIPYNINDFETEKRTFLQKILKIEPLRKNTKQLFESLRKENHQLGVYTTSYRKKWKIRLQFRSYGIPLDFIINEKENQKTLSKNKISASKHPPSFKIDFHIDDAKGMEIEGEKYGFKTIIITKNNLDWIEKIYTNIKF
ncbi:HAD family hydrolase [Aureivirga sp. CE67]|uniref:HAD family hydrolase n=1 Tax=Aureivirga sp. CE67 TaxID=1788983 RepID=UPI0018CACEAD|nr:HAD family hydrolase [Aureivirga sp. CE67]